MDIKTYIANKLFRFVMRNSTYHGKMTKDLLIILTKINHANDETLQTVESAYINKLCQEFLKTYGLDEISEKRYKAEIITDPKFEIEELRKELRHNPVTPRAKFLH